MTDLENHPASEIFPLMEGPEFDLLVKDIREHGQQEPIVLHDGLILDGRNRYRACSELGKAPRTKIFAGSQSPEEYVFSENIVRRHLNESQRAMVAAKIATAFSGERADLVEISTRSVTAKQAANKLNIDRSNIFNAKTVLAEGTVDEIESCESGEAAVSTTAKKIRHRTKVAKETAPTPQTSNHRIKTPPGKTLEDVCRQGIALELGGASTQQAAKQIGINLKGYRDGRYIIWLIDRDDLSARDQEAVAEALSFMNSNSVSARPYEMVSTIVERVWGKPSSRVGKRGDKGRMKAFDRAYGTITQVCFCAADVDLPQLSAERTSEIVSELKEAIKCLRAFQTRIEEIHK